MQAEQQIIYMKETNPTMIDKQLLRDIKSITVNEDLPIQERIHDYVEQIGNPYCFLHEDMIVKLRFNNTGCDCKTAFLSMIETI